MQAKIILVIDADRERCRKLCGTLEQHHYRPVAKTSLKGLPELFQGGGFCTLVLDIDTLPVDNLFIRGLKNANPRGSIIATSSRSFHPELEEAMSSHIDVCLRRPFDTEELLYWIRSLSPEDC